ncbi:MAG: 4-hydroxythreonine-4-phosphate dehydrogenase PdxA, partial [Candidatus Omnitrophota bacterium]|nr:4-hydroxythreonine-4-phosphate dehydrogenase PdxA [Candidatus Omnitrophota bacterium]
EFDGVVCLYHDQGLIPLKMVARNEGVNITLGLGFVRTSPDHGTAFEIAGKGKADHRSMEAAIKTAVSMAVNRKRNAFQKRN